VGQSARSAQSRQNTWRFRVVNTESRLEAERLPEAKFVAPLRIWEVEPDLPAKTPKGLGSRESRSLASWGPKPACVPLARSARPISSKAVWEAVGGSQ
jgi:hypothetical protein